MTSDDKHSDDIKALAPFFAAARAAPPEPSQDFMARAMAAAEAACPQPLAPARRRRVWPAWIAALRPGAVVMPGATLAGALVLGLGLGLGLIGEGAGLAMADVLDAFLPGSDLLAADAGIDTMFAAALEEGFLP